MSLLTASNLLGTLTRAYAEANIRASGFLLQVYRAANLPAPMGGGIRMVLLRPITSKQEATNLQLEGAQNVQADTLKVFHALIGSDLHEGDEISGFPLGSSEIWVILEIDTKICRGVPVKLHVNAKRSIG